MLAISDLPLVNACLNSLSCFFLLVGRGAIFFRKEDLHRRLMSAAFLTSSLFLASYLYYHFNTEVFTPYQGLGLKRTLYYIMLFSHIVLAILTTPAILALLYFALSKNFSRHRTLAAYVWPLWLYISVTGVLIYYMLYA
jgi:putative membrane protein